MKKYKTRFKLKVVKNFLASYGEAKLLARRWTVSEEKIRTWVRVCHQSIKGNHSASQVNCPQAIACGLVVASCDSTVLLELGKEVLNQVASLVQMLVITALVFARVARWDDDLLARIN